MHFNIVGPGYTGRSSNLDASRCINFYAEMGGKDAKDVVALVGTPGTKLWINIASMPIRGMHVLNGLLYVVIGGKLYSITLSGSMSSALGALAPSAGRVLMSDNGVAVLGVGGNQLMIVDGIKGYIYNILTGTFLDIDSLQYTIAGSTTGTFTNGEVVTQGTTGATAIVTGLTVPSAGPMSISDLSGSPDVSHAWVGTTSTASFTPTAVPVQKSTGWPGDPVGLTYCDGYFVILSADNMQSWASNLYDGTTWTTLSVAAICSAPDLAQCVFNEQEQLWVLKEYTSEVWYNAGTSTDVGFPFARMSGAVLDIGIAAPRSAARGANSLFFLANQRNNDGGELVGVAQITGQTFTPQIVSPPAITYQMSQYASVVDAFGYCYSDGGHTFYVLTFPSANATWVYDTTTGLWHERSMWTGNPYQVNRHIGNCYAYFGGMHLIGDFQNGIIYQMSNGFYDDNGNPLVSVRTCQYIVDKNDFLNIFIKRLSLDMETGVAIEGSPPPQVALSWSDDSGHKWSNDYAHSIGAVGEYKRRVPPWTRLGVSRNRIFRIAISDPVKRIVMGAYIN